MEELDPKAAARLEHIMRGRRRNLAAISDSEAYNTFRLRKVGVEMLGLASVVVATEVAILGADTQLEDTALAAGSVTATLGAAALTWLYARRESARRHNREENFAHHGFDDPHDVPPFDPGREEFVDWCAHLSADDPPLE